MEEIPSIRLKRLHGRLGDVVYQLTKIQFSYLNSRSGWSPDINAYRCDQQIVICVDLAGVETAGLDLRVEPGRLRISGRREPPEPACNAQQSVQVLAMEIDYGPFVREITLPLEVDPQRVKAEQKSGFVWIYLPFRPHS
jgi:HSP20 family protein